MKAVIEIIMAVIFMIGAVTIPIGPMSKIRTETLIGVNKGLSPLGPFTYQLTKKRIQ